MFVFLSFVVVILPLIHSEKPNIVVFIADDLGIGDLGCFGNTSIKTPNIDKLCSEGVKFTHHLAVESLCTPSRAAFLTGRYPVRLGLAREPNSAPVIMYTSGRAGLSSSEITWPKILQNHNYITQAVGKWHLGWDEDSYGDQKHGPLGHGFDHFYGLPFTLVDGIERNDPFFTYENIHQESMLHSHLTALILSFVTVLAVYSQDFGYFILVAIVVFFCLTWVFLEHFSMHKVEDWWKRSAFMEKLLNSVLMEDTKVVEQPIKLPQLMEKLTNFSLNFIHSMKNSTDPFLLYHSFSAVHTPLSPGRGYKGRSEHGHYGDSVIEMDDAVGQILEALSISGLKENTLVYFTSDHGAHIDIGEKGGSNQPYKGGKGIDPSEGGIRVPAIMKWPGKITAESTIDEPISMLDFRATVEDLVSQKYQPASDGKSFLHTILDKEESLQEEASPQQSKVLRHYCGTNLHALRIKYQSYIYKVYRRYPKVNKDGHCGRGMLCGCFGHDIDEFKDLHIYNLTQDPTENVLLTNENKTLQEVKALAHQAFEKADKEDHPPSQLSKMIEVMPRPWMQPCSHFPFCYT